MTRNIKSELDVIFTEIMAETTELKAYRLGVANTGKLLYEVLVQLEGSGQGSIDIADFKSIIENSMSDDDVIQSYFKRLMK